MKNIFLILLWAGQACYGFTPPISLGSSSKALGHYAFLSNDVWSVYNAPNAMRFDSIWQAGLAYSSPFWVDELRTVASAVNYSKGNQSYGVCLSFQGYSVWNNVSTTLAFCQRFQNNNRLGVSLRHARSYFIENNRAEHRLGISCAWQLNMNKALTYYGQLHNIPMGVHQLRYIQFSSALNHRVNESAQLVAQLSIAIDNAPRFTLGILYRIRTSLHIYGALCTGPTQLSLGLRYSLKRIVLTTAFSQHQRLRHSQSFDIQTL